MTGRPPDVAGALEAVEIFVKVLAATIYDVNQFSLRQAVTPDRLRGRVNAGLRVLIRGTVPLGALLGGALAELAGLRAAVLVGALGPVAALALVWRSPVRALREPPAPVEETVAA